MLNYCGGQISYFWKKEFSQLHVAVTRVRPENIASPSLEISSGFLPMPFN